MNANSPSLAELVASDASRAKVFDDLGLDYCCHGNESLDYACARAGIDPDAVVRALDGATPAATDDHSCAGLSPERLIAHLLDMHHTYLHRELPEVERLATKVLAVHGERHAELERVHALVTDLALDLEPHMLKEERVLFPAILRLVEGPAEFPFGSIKNPVAMMSVEHERVGALLAELRAVTSGYRVPVDACASYRALYERLEVLEHDTHLHVFEENQLLFRAVVALEA